MKKFPELTWISKILILVVLTRLEGGKMSTPERKTTDIKSALFDPTIERKPKPDVGFEVPVFKDKPEVKPVVKTPLPPSKQSPEKP